MNEITYLILNIFEAVSIFAIGMLMSIAMMFGHPVTFVMLGLCVLAAITDIVMRAADGKGLSW